MALRETEFRESLLAHLGALEAMRDRLAAEPVALLPSIHRLARSLEIIAGRRPRRRIERAAAALAAAEPQTVEGLFEELWSLLQEAVRIVPRRPARLVVVESDATTAKIVQSALSASHREIHLAGDGATAERLLARRRCGLIVLGLDLPDTDGRDLLLRLRGKSRTAHTPIFVLDPFADSNTALECLALGADRCFTTPIDPNYLAAEVNARMKVLHAIESRTHQDPLTGLANAEGLAEGFDRLAAFCRRSGSPLSLGLLELTGLREINDRRGDEAGDACLIHASTVFRESLRQSDLVARWDGDAFVVLLPNTRVEGAAVALGKIRHQLRQSPVQLPGGGEIDLDFAAGVAEVEAVERAGEAVEQVDPILQQARRQGAGTILTSADPPAPRSNVVLLVEDDPISASVIRHRLSRDGFDVRHFADGEEALRASKRLDPTLVLLDVKLPGIDGFELLRILRADDRFENVPIAIVSVLADEGNVVRGLELGADDYIAKPFSTTELRARIQRMLQKRGIPAPEAAPVPVTTGEG